MPFNPILVWFYLPVSVAALAEAIILSIPFWSDFIAGGGTSVSSVSHTFQSHFGLILSSSGMSVKSSHTVSGTFQSHFGLILSSGGSGGGSSGTGFQSHFGLILSQLIRFGSEKHARLSIPFWSDFIEPAKALYSNWRTLSIPFWSDFILQRPCTPLSAVRLSIPFWSDFINAQNEWHEALYLSIPFWSDFILSKNKFTGFVSFLSIPFWSDFILNSTLQKKKRESSFQSHFGLILSSDVITLINLYMRFQSHFGLILSKCWRFDYEKRKSAFNPILVWFYRHISCTRNW